MGAPPPSAEAAPDESEGLDLRRQVTLSLRMAIVQFSLLQGKLSSSDWSQLILHRFLVLAFCVSKAEQSLLATR